MTRHVNQCRFVGELITEPQVEYSTAGNAYAKPRLRMEEEYDGKTRSVTVNFTLFGDLAESLDKFQKGDIVLAEGRFNNRKSVDREGKDVWSVSIIASKFEKAQ